MLIFPSPYVVAAGGGGGVPEITAFNEGDTYGNPTVAVGASNAGDQIIIIVNSQNGETASATNFTATSFWSGSASRTTILIWDGGGTRPNSSNVSVTLSGANNCAWQSYVVSGTTTSSVTVGSPNTGTSNTGPTMTGVANSLLFHVVCLEYPGATISGTTPSPSGGAEPARPCTEGSWSTIRNTDNAGVFVFTLENASAGTTTALQESHGYTTSTIAVFEVS